ncbi:hypothetical protein vseg_005186 [Gypsophila vaccaria]
MVNKINPTFQHGFVLMLLCFMFLCPIQHAQLNCQFYDVTCPNLTKIVRSGVSSAMSNDTRMAASLLRLHFHDCIVNGCDGSILLDDTPTMIGEKNANPNKNSVRGFEVIDAIKTAVETACPAIVSCTDILALAAREAVFLTGGPCYPLPMGRRDGLTANINDANQQIPSPFEPLENITAKFTSKGLQLKDVAVLSGAHTIGFAQCSTFKSRLFNFDGTGEADPTLDTRLLQNLQQTCTNLSNSNTNLSPLDLVTSTKFDNLYYSNLLTNSGLLQSDQQLMGDNVTSSLAINYSKKQFDFFRDFGLSMVNLGNVEVLTGQSGQVRKNCRVVN